MLSFRISGVVTIAVLVCTTNAYAQLTLPVDATGAEDSVSTFKITNTGQNTAAYFESQANLGGPALRVNASSNAGAALFESINLSGQPGVQVTANCSGAGSECVGVLSESLKGVGVSGVGTTYGVQGSGTVRGIYGFTRSSTSGDGVFGENTTSTGSGFGVYGKSVNGIAGYFESTTAGVALKGRSYNSNTSIWGYNNSGGVGVTGESTTTTGVFGTSSGADGVLGSSSVGNGLRGNASAAGVSGVYGQNSNTSWTAYGVAGRTYSLNGIGIYGDYAYGGYPYYGYAGYFNGRVHVNGTLSKSAGSFKIDHPLDPENQYLSHSFVESPDMKNIYDGTVVLDASGSAWVVLPEYFEALNRDFRYQLTPIGGAATLYVKTEILQSKFQISGGAPGLKASWQVTGIRKDAYANQNRIPVEEPKPAAKRGRYLNPEAFGKPRVLADVESPR